MSYDVREHRDETHVHVPAEVAKTLARGQSKARAMRRAFAGIMPRRTAARLYAQAEAARREARGASS